MPARKNNTSMASEEAVAPPRDGLSVEDLSLPRTMVQRLAKGVLPPNTQIQKDALLAMSKGATVFVNYLTNTSNENAVRGGKKTIQPRDVLDAVKELEFEAFLPRLEAELQKYNAIQCEKRNSYRKKVREAAKAKANPNAPDASEDALAANGHSQRGPGGDSPPAAKKARRSSVDGGEHATVTEGEDTDGDMGDNGEGDDDQQDHEDDEVEDEEEGDEGAEEQLVEDPIEMRENEEVGDDASEGEESD